MRAGYGPKVVGLGSGGLKKYMISRASGRAGLNNSGSGGLGPLIVGPCRSLIHMTSLQNLLLNVNISHEHREYRAFNITSVS